MHWLSHPKVRLGLVVNMLYFLSLSAPTAQHTRARPFARTYERTSEQPDARLRVNGPPEFAPLPPSSAEPMKAESHYWKESDQLDVYLTRELLLIRRYNHTLLMSPSFTTNVLNPGRPRSVLMYFTAFSYEQNYDRDSPFVITADGDVLWRYGSRGPSDATLPYTKVLHSARLDNNQVVETLGHEIPYDVFVQLTRARRVTFELGPDTFELTAEQLNAIRDMRGFISSAPSTKPGVDYVPYSNSKRNP
jgi:hypothetical protein